MQSKLLTTAGVLALALALALTTPAWSTEPATTSADNSSLAATVSDSLNGNQIGDNTTGDVTTTSGDTTNVSVPVTDSRKRWFQAA